MKQCGLLVAVFFCCCAHTFAQQLEAIPGADASPHLYPSFKPDAAMRGKLPPRQQEADKRVPPDSMPVYKYGKAEERFLCHNQNGTDVYAAATDMMFIVKPDASFTSNMPVLKERYKQQQSQLNKPGRVQPLWPPLNNGVR